MSVKNYDVQQCFENGGGNYVFLMKGSNEYTRFGSELMAIFDYNSENQLYRIEVVGFQNRIVAVDGKMNWELPNANSQFVFQIGDKIPVSYIIWLSRLQEKSSSSHTPGTAWALVDGSGELVGLEAILPQ